MNQIPCCCHQKQANEDLHLYLTRAFKFLPLNVNFTSDVIQPFSTPRCNDGKDDVALRLGAEHLEAGALRNQRKLP